MVSMILRFAESLRYNGLTVSTSALHYAISAMKWVDLMNKRQVFSALESCLVQNMDEREKFKEIFAKFFENDSRMEIEQEEAAYRIQVKEFVAAMRKDGDYIGRILADYMDGDVMGLFQNIGDDKGFRIVYDETASGVGMNKGKVRLDILKRIDSLSDSAADFANASFHMPKDKRDSLSEYLKQRLREAANLIENKKKYRKSR
ncbi:hypothetical protein KKA14_10855, partial [bacterium]|nr:hypothetical protein [bacterium]